MARLEHGRSTVDGRGIRPPRAFAVEAREAPEGFAVLALKGEFDMAAATALREALAGAMSRAATVVVDMTGVAFIDSSTLKELLRGDAELCAAGRRLVVAGVGTAGQRLLELTRADELLTVVPTVEDALRGEAG